MKDKRLKDVLHAMNVLEIERDLNADGYEAVAVVPPIRFTPEGLKEFKVALNSKMYDEYTSSDSEEVDSEVNRLLWAMAGYCSTYNFEKWFIDTDAKEI